MKMWMIDVKCMCDQHLMIEHADCHLFLKALKRKRNLLSYIRPEHIEIKSLKKRHDIIAEELKRRNIIHTSDLFFSFDLLDYLPAGIVEYKIDIKRAEIELICLCKICGNLIRSDKHGKKQSS